MIWLAFAVGLFLGAFLGLFIMGLLCAGRDFYDNDGEF
jgi:hypothetical protein